MSRQPVVLETDAVENEMSTATPALMTVEDLDALSDNDGIDRELIRGELRERPMTRRNRFHTAVEARVAYLLIHWQRQTNEQGTVASGEVGCIMRRDPDTSFGIDVAYFSQEVVEQQSDETQMFDGAPLLAVEILSPSDKHVEVCEKVREYLDCGVSVVWVVDPDFRTVQVHRQGDPPETFNQTMLLSGGSDLPGFQVPVAELFE